MFLALSLFFFLIKKQMKFSTYDLTISGNYAQLIGSPTP